MHAIDALLLAIVASTPLLLAVEGEVIVQRSGIINLGIEGMMLAAAMAAALTTQLTGNIAAGFAGGIAGAVVMAAIFGVFAIVLRVDQIVTGTAINLLSLGATGFMYREMQAIFARPIPRLENNFIVVIAWIVVPILLAAILWRTMFGLRLRACGENPDAVGRAVSIYRWSALAIESVLVGIAGAHLALALFSGFPENMTAGRGFIALSIVIFGRWKFKGALLGTAVFGVAAAAQYPLPAGGVGFPFYFVL